MDYKLPENRTWPQDGLEKIACCPICRGAERKLLYDGLTDKTFFCAPGRWSLYQCCSCGTAYLDPRPTQATLAMAYSTYYTHEERDNASKGLVAYLKLRLRNGYLNSRYNSDLTPSFKAGRWVTPLFIHKRMQIDDNVRHLPTTPGILVDIGCGNGQYLHIAKKLGWETWGVELDPKAAETARNSGAKIIMGGFPDTGLPSQHFDVVTLSHVIEHVHNPIAALQEVFRVLKPGGQVWISTPNLDSLGHARFGSNWRGLEPPRHLVLFTLGSLRKALIGARFRDVVHKPCLPQALWFYQCSLRIAHGEDPNVATVTTMPLALQAVARFADLRAIITQSGCETIVLTAKKPESA